MKLKRQTKLLIESPASATGDIAFNLIVFFLVCAAVPYDTGRTQAIPKAEPEKEEKDQTKPIEVAMTRQALTVDGNPVTLEQLEDRVRLAIGKKAADAGRDPKKPIEQDRIVVVSTKDDKSTPFERWIKATTAIDSAKGIVTVQIEEERVIQAD